MFRLLLILMLVFLASIVGWLAFGPDNPLPSVESNVARADSSQVSLSQSVLFKQVPSKRKVASQDTADSSVTPSELQGRALQQQLETFWLTCQSEQNCQAQLAQLSSSLSDQDYDLVANYPELKQQWQYSIGSMELNQFATLAEKVAQVKRQAEMVWGLESSRVLADEFTLYDFSLEAQSLISQPAEEYVQQYQQLIERWQANEATLSLTSDVARFEKALTLLPSNYTLAQRQQVVEQLSSLYLTPTQVSDILARQQQVATQEQQVMDYQSQLSELKFSLSSQRTTTFAQMSDSQWQAYYQQQIDQFRIEFFSIN
ncbi:chromosome partitioning protein ParA [Vibrio sp. NH-UV-68]|uniref:chromosome partitioning protein ParA n=1 Tax=unclassified Vibrio TaxID=2614977 RepID=UPI0036F2CE00